MAVIPDDSRVSGSGSPGVVALGAGSAALDRRVRVETRPAREPATGRSSALPAARRPDGRALAPSAGTSRALLTMLKSGSRTATAGGPESKLRAEIASGLDMRDCLEHTRSAAELSWTCFPLLGLPSSIAIADPPAMPLHWTIDSRLKLFVVTAKGFVDFAEVNRMLDAMVGADVHGYRKMFDGTLGDTRMSPTELLSLGVRMRSLHAKHPMGPLALVIPEDKYYLIARVLGMLAAAKRPMRVFKDPKKARQWLDSPAIRARMPEPFVDEPSH